MLRVCLYLTIPNADENQPAVYAPMAKNATYPRSSRPAKPTTMFSPSAITT